jgi:hypothetical protein
MPHPSSVVPGLPRRLLWVEGKDDRAVVESLCGFHDVPELFQVREQRGVTELLRGLPLELRAPDLERFGIVVDANGDVTRRWQTIRDILRNEGYERVPDHVQPEGTVITPPARSPWFGAWIMPDNSAPGAIEEFAAALVPADDFLWVHAANTIDAIPEQDRRFPPLKRAKAHIHTWLAWQEAPGSPMGQAITKGDLDARAPLADAFVAWLRRLMVSEKPGAGQTP